MMKELEQAIEATKLICSSIAASDFATDYGTKTAYGIREYKADICLDIVSAILGRELTYEDRQELGKQLADADWGIIA